MNYKDFLPATISVRGIEPRLDRLKVDSFIQLSYTLTLIILNNYLDFEQIRTVDVENHFGFTVQRFRPTELRNLIFINLTKN